jgi:hypothetical protein
MKADPPARTTLIGLFTAASEVDYGAEREARAVGRAA